MTGNGRLRVAKGLITSVLAATTAVSAVLASAEVSVDARALAAVKLLEPEALQQAARANRALPLAPNLGRAAFLGARAWEQLSLSPDGRWLAFSHRQGNDISLSLEAVSGGARRVWLNNLNGARWQWSGDGKGVWLIGAKQLVWLPLVGNARTVYGPKKELRTRVLNSDPLQQAIWLEEREQLAHDSAHRLFRVYSDGRVETVLRRAEGIRSVAFDAQGELRALRLRNTQYRDAIWHQRAPASAAAEASLPWQRAYQCPPLDLCNLVAADAQQLWFESPKVNERLSLLRWQTAPAKSKEEVTLVAEDPQRISDLSDVLRDARGGAPLAVAWYTDRQRWQALQAEFAPVLRQLEQKFPGRDLELDIDADRHHLLILERHARMQLPRAHVMDLKTGAIRPVLDDLRNRAAPVPEDALTQAQFISWQARDGMRLYGQLYLPPGRDARDLPLVALVHGGPFSQTRSEYHRWTQLMVSRGVAVFTPNFRASEGYGQQYLLAHKGDFGDGAVLRDIVEGMDAVLAQGIGDSTRQAIVGHSFGGYASLMAVTHYPERFRFAIALAAPSDFGSAMRWYADNENDQLRGDGLPMAQRAPYLGMPIDDPAFLNRMREQSAVAHAKKLQVPVYLWAGAADDRVPLKSIAHYAATLKSLGKPVSLLVDEKAGHNPSEPVQWEAFFYLSERALFAHFGGDAPVPPSAVLQDYLRRAQRFGALP